MQQQQPNISSRSIVEADAKDIYLGNLNRVDADLNLPLKGKRGSGISWHSGEILFLNDEGKITRPSNGVGNRMVPLTATLTYEDACCQRQFDVMVIEEEKTEEIVKVHPVELLAAKGDKITLPPVVIVDNANGTSSVARVVWATRTVPGPGTVSGKVEGTDLPATAVVACTDDTEAVHPHRDRTPLVRDFNSSDVALEPGSPFYHSQEAFLNYLLTVNDDQMLYNFRAAARLDTLGAPPMTGWDAPECNLKGHTTGHYLSALSLAWHSTKNEQIKSKLDYMVRELEKCQTALSVLPGCHEGFLSAYSEEQFDLLQEYTTYPTIWAPYYTLHKIMAGLMDCYHMAGNERALAVCSRLGDWVYRRLSVLPQEQLDKMWSMYIAGEFGGIIEALVRLHLATGNKNYLTAAKYFRNDKLYYPMSQNVDTLEDMHANQHIPQIIGAMKLFEAEGEEKYYRIGLNFWRMVTGSHIYSIGGTGENEMFKGAEKIGGFLTAKTAESCATYNMLKLTRELYQYSGDSSYMDYYEQALYNHILASCDSEKKDGGTTYFMPLAPGSQKVFQTAENTCCHGTGLENHFKYGEAIYFHDEDSLFVNLYIPSSVQWKDRGIRVVQSSDPQSPGRVCLNIEGSARFTLKLRKPFWAADKGKVLINGTEHKDISCSNGYLTLSRDWNGDTVEILFQPELRLNRTPDCPDVFSLSYGPYTLVALSEEPDFLHFAPDEKDLARRIVRKDGGLQFELEGLTLLPLYRVTDQKYHAYFKFR